MEIFLYGLEIITIITGVLIGIDKVVGMVAKHKKGINEKTRQKLVENYRKIFDQLMPEYLQPLNDKVDKIKEINEEQSATIELLKSNTQEIFRQQIEDIYYTYRAEKSFPQYIKEVLDEKYQIYTAANGNHHIGKLYKRMCKWSTYDAVPEYDKDINDIELDGEGK